MDAGLVFKLGRIFRIPYGGHSIDFIDALNYQFTGGLMVIFIVIIGFRQYVGKPLQCWLPPEFTKSWEEYIENLCWVSSTYFLEPSSHAPRNRAEVLKHPQIGYYQWVAIVLAGQSMMGWVPHLIWRVGSKRLPLLVKSAREAAVPDKELRHKAVSCLVAALEEQAEAQTRFKRIATILTYVFGGIPPNARLALLFIVVRLLFIANSVGQVYIMRRFIGGDDFWFGWTIFQNLLHGNEWYITGHFPRVTYCTIPIRKLGYATNTYTVQCVLPINYFVEKVYVFLWFWFLIIGILTCLSTVQWCVNILVPFVRCRYITQYLRAMKLTSATDDRDCSNFVGKVLGPDGILTLHVVSKSASDLIALDVVATLWKHYKQAKTAGVPDDINRLLTEKMDTKKERLVLV